MINMEARLSRNVITLWPTQKSTYFVRRVENGARLHATGTYVVISQRNCRWMSGNCRQCRPLMRNGRRSRHRSETKWHPGRGLKWDDVLPGFTRP